MPTWGIIQDVSKWRRHQPSTYFAYKCHFSYLSSEDKVKMNKPYILFIFPISLFYLCSQEWGPCYFCFHLWLCFWWPLFPPGPSTPNFCPASGILFYLSSLLSLSWPDPQPSSGFLLPSWSRLSQLCYLHGSWCLFAPRLAPHLFFSHLVSPFASCFLHSPILGTGSWKCYQEHHSSQFKFCFHYLQSLREICNCWLSFPLETLPLEKCPVVW